MRDGREEVWVVGCPKSGNTWLTRLVAEALDSPAGAALGVARPPSSEGLDRPGLYWVYHDHLSPNPERAGVDRVIHVHRDLRDVVVSAMYYWELGTIDDAITKIAERWAADIRYWVMGVLRGPTAFVSYEQLVDDASYHLGRVLDRVGLVPVVDLDVVVAHQEFYTKRRWVLEHGHTLAYGAVAQRALLRKGVVGDWRNHFTRADARRVHDGHYDLLRYLGYETDRDWWDGVPLSVELV